MHRTHLRALVPGVHHSRDSSPLLSALPARNADDDNCRVAVSSRPGLATVPRKPMRQRLGLRSILIHQRRAFLAAGGGLPMVEPGATRGPDMKNLEIL
jgi:hypothetical protein